VDRESATRRMLRALAEFEIGGMRTLIPFHRALLATDEWRNGGTGHALLADKVFLSGIDAPTNQGAPAGAG
jgi:acetyl-CoA/propionyl-CoA carboxylase biotin carboxyl carrier protein